MRPVLLLAHSLLGLALTMQGCGRSDIPSDDGSGPRVGAPAPEIDGPDTDGVRFKLSDYRGKVVMISFWAGWCPPCRDLFPHERSLVDKYQNRPFVLLGVNGDPTQAAAQRVIQDNALSWRSWWAGEKSELADLPDRWRLFGWPTVFVLDPQGVIRFKATDARQARQADAVIESLVREAEAARKAS